MLFSIYNFTEDLVHWVNLHTHFSCCSCHICHSERTREETSSIATPLISSGIEASPDNSFSHLCPVQWTISKNIPFPRLIFSLLLFSSSILPCNKYIQPARWTLQALFSHFLFHLFFFTKTAPQIWFQPVNDHHQVSSFNPNRKCEEKLNSSKTEQKAIIKSSHQQLFGQEDLNSTVP